MEKDRYLVSVIIPVYNAEKYLEATILSVVNQTIGFENSIELILVNNATADNSGDICLKYLMMYPQNVKYIELEENHGPCGARNAGLREAQGKYINFLDADDLWETDALQKLTGYLEMHREIVFASARLRHFDGKNCWHGLDWKYKDNDAKTVNILENPDYLQLHLCSVVIRGTIARQYQHDENVYHAEDAKYVSEILLDYREYAIVPEAVFLYRSRISGDSTLQTVNKSTRWYFDTPRMVYQYLMDKSVRIYGTVIQYIQYLVMYELQWRMNDLPSDHVEEYKGLLYSLLERIDDSVILSQRSLWRERKLYLISKKKNSELQIKDNEFYLNGSKVWSPEEGLFLKSIVLFNGKLHIQGFIRFPFADFKTELFLCADGVKKKITYDKSNENYDVFALGENAAHADSFFYIINSDGISKIEFYLLINGKEYRQKIRGFRNTKIEIGEMEIREYEINSSCSGV